MKEKINPPLYYIEPFVFGFVIMRPRSATKDFSHTLMSNEHPSNRHPTHLGYDGQKEIS